MLRDTLRRVRVFAGPLALLGVLALVAALLATAAPRVVNQLADHALGQDITEIPGSSRDLILTRRPDPHLDRVDAPTDTALLDAHQRALPAPLPALVSERWFTAGVGPKGATTILPSGRKAELGLRAQTELRRAARLSAGRWPASRTDGRPEIIVSTANAAKLGLHVGSVLTLGEPLGPAKFRLDVVVVGLFEPLDPAAPFWDDMPLALDTPLPLPEQPFLAVAMTDFRGLSTAALPLNQLTYTWRYRIDERRLTGANLDATLTAISQVLRTPPQFGLSGATIASRTVASTALDSKLEQFSGQVRAVRGLLTVVQAGLLATLFGLVLLAAGLAVARRRKEFTVLRARGATALAVGRRVLGESLMVVPAAVAAGWYAGTLVPGRPAGTGALVLAIGVLTSLATPALATASQWRTTFVTRRDDLARYRPSPRRLTAELLVLLLGGLGAYLLRRRGLASDGVDPYLVSVPVLLAGGAAIVVLRALPWPLAMFGRLSARWPTAVPFLGLTRAARTAPASVGPIAVVVLALATAVFSGTIRTTVDAARDRVSEREIPAAAQVTGYDLPLGAGDRIAAAAGVSAVTPLVLEPGTGLRAGNNPAGQALVVIVEPESFARVVAASGLDVRLPAELTDAAPRQRSVPAVVSPAVAADLDAPAGSALVHGLWCDFAIARVVDRFPGIPSNTHRFVILPRQSLAAIPDSGPIAANRYLVAGDRLDPVALRSVAERAQRELTPAAQLAISVPAPVEVTTRVALRASLDRTGGNEVLTVTYLVGVLGGAVLALLAVGFAVLAGVRERGRALSRLRTMGLSRRQGRGLLVYELVPLVGVAALAGGLVGLALPELLGPALGLERFTFGEATRVSVRPLLVGALLGLVVAALAAATALEDLLNRRLRLNEVLRLGEEQA